MGKIVEGTKTKKKGRPYLLDLQKRSLKEQKQQLKQSQHQYQPTPNPCSLKTTPITPNPFRRSTSRNPNPDGVSEASGDEEDELNGKRREKNLLLLKIVDGCKCDGTEKGENHVFDSNPSKDLQGSQLDTGPSAPLPDKKLLLFILDRLQKKDTYGVFSEPVDSNELPDYHEVIDHPMDFGTVRKKVVSGTYANLEQFEKDVHLICLNTMQYNAPETVYFRQARSIQELANKNFENLRQDSDGIEPERKVARRGRPPTKNLTKQMFRPSLERAGSEFSDATLATAGENTTWSNNDLKEGPPFDKSGPADFSGQSFLGSRSNEPYAGWLAEHKLARNDEFLGSILKGNGKKQVVFGENRHITYNSGGQEPSVFTTFGRARKQLVAVGVHLDFGYGRSLAHFAANLGPVTWMVASKKIRKSLPSGINFGPGWVGENEVVTPSRPLIIPSKAPVQLTASRPFSLPGNSCKANTVERDKLSENRIASAPSDSDSSPSNSLLSSPLTSSNPIVAVQSPETISERAVPVRGLNSHSGFNSTPIGSSVGVIRSGPPFQSIQNKIFRNGTNGMSGAYGFHFPAQMGKPIESKTTSGIDFQPSAVDDTISGVQSSVVHSASANGLNSEGSKLLENKDRSNSSSSLPSIGCEEVATLKVGNQQLQQPSRQEVSSLSHQQQRPDSGPPDLNIRFQTPGSPNK